MQDAHTMYNLTFEPFVGKKYYESNPRILILGESHYITEDDVNDSLKDITRNVLTSYLGYRKGEVGEEYTYGSWMKTFTRFANVFNGRKMSDTELVSFWNSVSFYNYVQYPIGKARVSPTAEDFLKSLDAFEKIVVELNPDLIVFWGYRLWNNFPKRSYKKLDKQNYHLIGLLGFNKDYPFLVIPHPSSSKLSYNDYSKIKEDIELINSLK